MDLLGEHRQTLDHLTELLLERETVDRTDVDEILGSIPGRRQPVGVTGQAANSAGGQEPTSQASCRAGAKPSV